MNKEITQAITELKIAQQNFQYADTAFINIAIMMLSAAEMKVETLLNLRNENGPTRMDPLVRENSLVKILDSIVPQQEQTVERKIQIQVSNAAFRSEKYLMATGKNF